MVNVAVKEGHEMFNGTQAKDIWPQYVKETKRDLPVFKALKKVGNKYYGLHTDHPYSVGKTYSTRFRMAVEWDHLTIERGYHSFYTCLDENKHLISLPEGVVWCEFVIPKGSHYFMDSYDKEMVSQTITFLREI